jgi:hypothetical protein
MSDKKVLFSILDIIMSEYGWSVEYCMKLPHDVLDAFYQAILERKRQDYYLQTKFTAYAVNAGFSGKIENIDKIFKREVIKDEKVDSVAWKAQLKALWLKMKKDPVEFERKWEAGENISL